MKINAIDLFCGVGGLTAGLQKQGSMSYGIDIESKCKFPYEKNNNAKFINADLKK